METEAIFKWLSALPLGPHQLNIKVPKNLETFPLASLHYDLQSDPSVGWKTSAFIQYLRSKLWVFTLPSLMGAGCPHPH